MKISIETRMTEITERYGEEFNTEKKINLGLEVNSSYDTPIYTDLIYPIIERIIGIKTFELGEVKLNSIYKNLIIEIYI